VSWTWTVRDPGAKVLREFTSMENTLGVISSMTNRQWLKDYVWRDGLLLATTTSTTTLHYHLDHLGTPRLITDANHIKVAEHAYYPFGAEIALTPHESIEEAMKFTGHERDIVAGDGHTLDDMHARFYNASLGRFLTMDRHEYDLGHPQTVNRYTYAENIPVRKVDPDGWQAVVPAPATGPNALLGLALYHVSQMRSNSAYRESAVNAVRVMQGITLGLILTVSRPFLVTPLGVILPGGKDVNLVPTSTGTDKWLQIHDSHPHDGAQPHTHEPETHTGPGGESVKRTDRPTTADDIDKADKKVKDGELRPRNSRDDRGDSKSDPDPKPDAKDPKAELQPPA
jgi:RHS repeat-associated protein